MRNLLETTPLASPSPSTTGYHPHVDWLITGLNVVGGAETFFCQAAPRLRQAGWDLHVITLRPGGILIDELRSNGVPVIELGVHSKTDIGVTSRLAQQWKADRPGLVHTHLYHAGLVGRYVARNLGIRPVIVHQQGAERNRSATRTLLDRLSSRWVSCYVASCQAVADILAVREGIPAAQIQVIFNGLDLSKTSTVSPLPDGWPVPENAPAIGCVGRLSPEKGQDILIQAVARIPDQVSGPHLVLLGDGSQRKFLESRSRQLGVEERVHFAGLRRDISDWLPHFDVFVLPSYWEGISLALLEAMATGLPVVATRTGGTPEVVVDGQTGILVPVGNVDELAKAISAVLSDTGLRQRLGEAGKARVDLLFSLDESVRQIDRLYRHLLDLESKAK